VIGSRSGPPPDERGIVDPTPVQQQPLADAEVLEAIDGVKVTACDTTQGEEHANDQECCGASTQRTTDRRRGFRCSMGRIRDSMGRQPSGHSLRHDTRRASHPCPNSGLLEH